MTANSRIPGAPRSAPTLIHAIALASGLAGLAYEIVWTRSLAVMLGHEIVAVLAVMSAFFAGMGLGAWVLHRPLSTVKRPAVWYAGLELGIGLWALCLAGLLPHLGSWAAALLGAEPSLARHWTLAFVLPFFLLLPATFAMGATLPALERWLSQQRRDGWVVGGVYGANTLGAAIGVLSATFLLVPSLGHTQTLWIMAGVNFFCAASALAIARRDTAGADSTAGTLGDHPATSQRALDGEVGITDRGRLIALFATGLLGIGFEVLVVRVLSQILESTVFSFAALLTVYLLGTAAGAWTYQAFGERKQPPASTSELLALTSLGCLASVASLPLAENLYPFLRELTGGGTAWAVVAEIAIAGLVFLPGTLAMGALFSHLAQGSRGTRKTIGHAFAVNTFGGALAAPLFGVLLLPAFGAKAALIGVAIGYLLLAALSRRRLERVLAVPALAAVVLAVAPFSLRFVTVPPGGELVAHRDGVMASVSVVSDARGGRHLKVNDRFQMGGTSSVFADRREAHLPLLLHPDPRRALFLGVGAGVTLGAVRGYPGLRTDAVELIPEVVDLLPLFESATGLELPSENPRILVSDARRFVATASGPYDVIVSDLFHPARDGAASLYTIEHFTAVRELLDQDGLFCQWLPLYQMDFDTFRTIARTFLQVFPDGGAWLAHYSLDAPIVGLIGGKQPLRLSLSDTARRQMNPPLAKALESIRLTEPISVPGAFAGGGSALSGFVGEGPINSDNRPVVLYRAPDFAYRAGRPSAEMLLDLVNSLQPVPADVLNVSGVSSSHESTRLAAYWKARDRFLAIGATITPTRDPELLLTRIEEPLVSVLEISPEFLPARLPLYGLARAVKRRNPPASDRILRRLDSIDSRALGSEN